MSLSSFKQLVQITYLTFVKESKWKHPIMSWHRVKERTCKTLGISKSMLTRCLNTTEKTAEDEAHGSPFSKDGHLDSFDRSIVKRTVLSLLANNSTVTLRKLQAEVASAGILLSKIKLWKILHSLGFYYGRPDRQSRKALMERADLVKKRIAFLRKMRRIRLEGKHVFYLDETWVDTHTCPAKQWLPPDGEKGRVLPTNKGQRFVILHCGGKEAGFLPGCELIFLAKSSDGRDYHSEMNGMIFEDWVRTKLIPALPAHSVIVMDNAPYHSMQKQESRAPTTASKKQDMINWLQSRSVYVDQTMKKPAIYELIKSEKQQVDLSYTVDSILQEKRHSVIRLPPYHCELNPIEMLWGDLKSYIASENRTFKKEDVRDLIRKGLQRIDQKKWEKACIHVEKLEHDWSKRDNIQHTPVNPVIVELDDSDDDSDGGSE